MWLSADPMTDAPQLHPAPNIFKSDLSCPYSNNTRFSYTNIYINDSIPISNEVRKKKSAILQPFARMMALSILLPVSCQASFVLICNKLLGLTSALKAIAVNHVVYTIATIARAWEYCTRLGDITKVQEAVPGLCLSFKDRRLRVGHDEGEDAGDHGEDDEPHYNRLQE